MAYSLRILLALSVVGLIGIVTDLLPMSFAWGLVATAMLGLIIVGVVSVATYAKR